MGGNALSCGSIRIDRPTHNLILDEISISPLEEQFDRFTFIRSYSRKETFGDIDFLYLKGRGDHTPIESIYPLLTEEFGATEFVLNGKVLSFDFRGARNRNLDGYPFELWYEEGPAVQIDLIQADTNEEFNFARRYYAFNDLGNLIGRIAHSMGFKLGHDGLSYKYLDGTQLIQNLYLTTDFGDALNFLDYSYTPYSRGFETLEDIFQYVSSSRYFRPEIFLLENRDGESRRRDAKRKTYMQFLEWCAVNQSSFGNRDHLKDIPKDRLLVEAFRFFPDFRESYAKATNDYFAKLGIKSRFNGDVVGQITGFTGKQLGDYMKYVRSTYESTTLFDRDVLLDPLGVLGKVHDEKEKFLASYKG